MKPAPRVLRRQQSSAGDWDVFAGVVGSEQPGAHPADRGAGQTWLIGQTPSASGSGKLLHAAYVPVVARPRTLDRQSSGGGWSRPAYQPQRSFRQAPPPVDEEPNVQAWMAEMRLRRPLPHRVAVTTTQGYGLCHVSSERCRPETQARQPCNRVCPPLPSLHSALRAVPCRVLSCRDQAGAKPHVWLRQLTGARLTGPPVRSCRVLSRRQHAGG